MYLNIIKRIKLRKKMKPLHIYVYISKKRIVVSYSNWKKINVYFYFYIFNNEQKNYKILFKNIF